MCPLARSSPVSVPVNVCSVKPQTVRAEQVDVGGLERELSVPLDRREFVSEDPGRHEVIRDADGHERLRAERLDRISLATKAPGAVAEPQVFRTHAQR